MDQPAIQQSHQQNPFPQRMIIGMTGASGAIFGIRMLEALRSIPIETHLVISDSGCRTILLETALNVEDVQSLADVSYHFDDINAAVASGSFHTIGMVIIPCSIKTLSSVANSFSSDLISRAADVTLKEGRPLILVVRETPYHPGHLRLMSEAAAAGAVIFPPTPAFYIHPHTLDDMIDYTVGRILSRMGIETDLYQEWQGTSSG